MREVENIQVCYSIFICFFSLNLCYEIPVNTKNWGFEFFFHAQNHARLVARVAIFREKNYSAEHGTDGNFGSFRRNAVFFAEWKILGIPFRAIPRL